MRGWGKFTLCAAVVVLSFAMPLHAGSTFTILAIFGAMCACLLVAKFIFRDPERRNIENGRKTSGEGTRDAPVLLIMTVPVVITIATVVAIIWTSGAGI